MGVLAFDYKTTFEVITCYKCHIQFGVTKQTHNKYYETGSNFYCPNGHSQHYTESREQKLKRQLDEKEQQLALETKRRQWAQRDAQLKEHQRRGEKAAKTRLKNRAKAGLCPCCNRTFKQLAAHMKNKHPDFNQEDKPSCSNASKK